MSESRSPSLGRVVIDDLRRTRDFSAFLRELQELYRFYLDEPSRRRLAEMGRFKRAFWLLGWLFKGLLLKLSPARRLMLLFAFLLAFAGNTSLTLGERLIDTDLRPWGFVLLLLVLMLELKDKLLARDEIEVARQVQLALLPQQQPAVRGWSMWSYTRPANDVGGDLVDYVTHDDGRVGVVLGDVAGKGLGAALLAAKLQATLRALIPDYRRLDELGALMNQILVRDGLDNRFATLFYVELEPESGKVRYLNAGHNPPCVVRVDGSESLRATSLPLGMIDAAEYSEGSLELAPGEMLVIYSDGLTEAANEQDEEFGAERLSAMLPELRGLDPELAGARLLRRVDSFLGQVRPGDDLSLVIVQRAEAAEAAEPLAHPRVARAARDDNAW